MSLLEQDTTRKRRVDKNDATELDVDNENREYEMKAIWDSAAYVRELESGHLLELSKRKKYL